ncbi:hypothetical protein TNCV_1302561 [Trichonephila clavipes]|nr:hypothetical protein TNCV_1302561 [Trichonephila clavipes]
MKPWILHARLELYKGMVVQSCSGMFLRGTVRDIWCVYQLPSMQFGTWSCDGAFIAISANGPLGFFGARMAILSNQLKKKNVVM